MNLFLFPHQDDECFVASLLQKNPSENFCTFLTTGGRQGALDTKRNLESRQALLELGIPESQIVFQTEGSGIADGELVFHLEDCIHWLQSQKFLKPIHTIFNPAYEGGHPDHDAACILGFALARHWKVQNLTFTTYHGYRKHSPFFSVRTFFPKERWISVPFGNASALRKTLALPLCYPSQWKTWLGLLPVLAWMWIWERRLILVLPDRKDFEQPPHPGRLYYESRNWMEFRVFCSLAQAFLLKWCPPSL